MALADAAAVQCVIPIVRDDDPHVFRQLLITMLDRLAVLGEPLLLVGLHETDPLLSIARQYSGREYVTRLYIVYWSNEVPDVGRLTHSAPYLELGAL
jgi:hypothetical protein